MDGQAVDVHWSAGRPDSQAESDSNGLKLTGRPEWTPGSHARQQAQNPETLRRKCPSHKERYSYGEESFRTSDGAAVRNKTLRKSHGPFQCGHMKQSPLVSFFATCNIRPPVKAVTPPPITGKSREHTPQDPDSRSCTAEAGDAAGGQI